jgi:3-keto-disaccharide hydrolase
MTRTAAALALFFGAALQVPPPTVEPGFTSLFNGKDLAGWKAGGPQESFSVQDGAIVTMGPTSHLYYDGAFRNHSFRNFELKVDVMTRQGANGGVYVLTEYEASGGNVRATGRFPSKGFEIQVNNSHTDRVRTGSLYHVSDIVDDSPVKDDEWFTEHIIVNGETITVNVNGKQVVRWTQPPDWDGGREGPGRRITGPGTVALQCHDPKSTVYYKNIRIKPLD